MSPQAKSLGGTTASSHKTESQLSKEPAKMMSYSQVKHSEQLELANGAGKPAHVSDTRTFVEEAAKSFAGMEGFDSLLGQLEMLATQPGIQVKTKKLKGSGT